MSTYEPALTQGIIFSDLVIRENGTGKLSLINCFNTFNVQKFPFRTPPHYIVSLITNLKGKIDELNVTARIEMQGTGHVVASVPGHMKFHPDSRPLSDNDIIEIPFPVKSYTVPEPGKYTVVILLNSEELGRRPIVFQQVVAKPSKKGN